MKVRTLKAHQNIHGVHAVGAEYEHNRPADDLKFGYIEAVPAAKATSPTKGATPKKAAQEKKASSKAAAAVKPADSQAAAKGE